MKPLNSVISGLLNRAQEDASSTGPQHGGRGVAIDAARDRLESQKPTETDRNLLAWLESSLSVVAKPEARMMFPAEGGFYRRTTGFLVSGLTPENRQTARDAVQASMTRPTVDKCEEWIAGLHAVTARRGDDSDTLALTMSLYAACLAQYPADVAKSACMEFAMRTVKPNWFPTLSELNEHCERATAQREQLLQALR